MWNHQPLRRIVRLCTSMGCLTTGKNDTPEGRAPLPPVGHHSTQHFTCTSAEHLPTCLTIVHVAPHTPLACMLRYMPHTSHTHSSPGRVLGVANPIPDLLRRSWVSIRGGILTRDLDSRSTPASHRPHNGRNQNICAVYQPARGELLCEIPLVGRRIYLSGVCVCGGSGDC